MAWLVEAGPQTRLAHGLSRGRAAARNGNDKNNSRNSYNDDSGNRHRNGTLTIHQNYRYSDNSTALHRNRNLQATDGSCNRQAYSNWASSPYRGVLSADVNFWMYQANQITLSNGLALQLTAGECTRLFDILLFYKAGRNGPITIQDSYKVMCSTYCLENDNLHNLAMEVSNCSCLDLSTPDTEVSYTVPGDWCYENSARINCKKLGFCGIWNCRVDDYNCERYEWNKKDIPLKGPGTCIRGAASKSYGTFSIFSAALVAIVATWLW